MTSVALVGSNGLLLSPVLTDIAAGFDETVGATGRALAAYSAGTALTAFWLGTSLDRFGLSRALALAMAVVGAAQIGSAFANGWIMLALMQGLAGAAAGVILPASYGITAAISPAGHEARLMSRVLFGWSVAMVAAVPLGAALADAFGWRMMLVFMGVLALAIAAMDARFLRSGRKGATIEKFGRLAPLRLTGGAAQYAIAVFFMMAFYGSYAYFGDYARASFAISAGAAGLIAMAYGVGFGISAIGATKVASFGRERVLPILLFLTALLLGGVWLAPNFAAFLAVMFFWGFFNHHILNMIVVGLNALAPDNRGAVMGLYSSVSYTAATLGVLLLGTIYETGGFIPVVLLAAGFILAATLLALRK